MENQYTYEVITDSMGTQLIKRSDNAYIPFDEKNSDYRQYLKDLENADK